MHLLLKRAILKLDGYWNEHLAKRAELAQQVKDGKTSATQLVEQSLKIIDDKKNLMPL